jgi:zinc-ribbon family
MSGGLFIFGRQTKKDYGPALLSICPNCKNETYFKLVYIKTWLEYFWIKIFPYKKRYYLLCDICSRGVELQKREIDAAKKLNEATMAYLDKSISTEQYKAALNEGRSELGIALGYLLK